MFEAVKLAGERNPGEPVPAIPRRFADNDDRRRVRDKMVQIRAQIFAPNFCATGTIKSRVTRARHALKHLIENEGAVKGVDLLRLKTASQGVPKDHPLYPIARAYEDLYAAIEGDSVGISGKPFALEEDGGLSQEEKAMRELVASGAFDENQESLEQLMQSEEL